MNDLRRKFLKRAGAGWVATVASTMVLFGPLKAFAADWNKAAFDAKSSDELLKVLGYGTATESKDILIKAPEIAENGAVVPIEITSKIPGTQSITLLVDKNPSPMVGEFSIAGGAEPYVSTRIKMGESSPVRVFVKAGGQLYKAARVVKVTIGGCGG